MLANVCVRERQRERASKSVGWVCMRPAENNKNSRQTDAWSLLKRLCFSSALGSFCKVALSEQTNRPFNGHSGPSGYKKTPSTIKTSSLLWKRLINNEKMHRKCIRSVSKPRGMLGSILTQTQPHRYWTSSRSICHTNSTRNVKCISDESQLISRKFEVRLT